MVDHLVARYRLPEPRTALADAVRAHASASMDVSDGLAGDLAKLCRASGVSAEIDVAKVPLSPAATRALAASSSLIEPILTGGEDYEILCAVPPAADGAFRAAAGEAGVPVGEIGRIVAGSAAPRFLSGSGQPMDFTRPAYSHF
jgi:thiamine-monophosphate kinase